MKKLDSYTFGDSKAAIDVVDIINQNNIDCRSFSNIHSDFRKIINVVYSVRTDPLYTKNVDYFIQENLIIIIRDFFLNKAKKSNINSLIKSYLSNLISTKCKEELRRVKCLKRLNKKP